MISSLVAIADVDNLFKSGFISFLNFSSLVAQSKICQKKSVKNRMPFDELIFTFDGTTRFR